MKQKILHVLLVSVFLIGIIWNLFATVWQNKDLYFSFTYWQRFPALEKVFLGSQYVNKHPTGWIPDETAFSYAGGKLIKGTNPVLVVPDAPPLGKYIIGLSTIIFNNENIVILFSAVVSLFLLYVLGVQVLRNKTIALVPPFLLTFERLFTNQLIYTPLLDLFQLVFLLASFIFFNLALTKKKSWVWFLLAGLSVGCFMATKFWVSGITIIFSWFVVLLLLKKWKSLFFTSLASIVSLIIVPLSYIRVFAFGYSFHSFLGIQKWIFLYHKSDLILPFSVWPLLLLNQWHVWFGNKSVIQDGQWSITWPILTIIFIITIIGILVKKISVTKQLLLILVWPIVYLLFFSVGEIFSRYFVILIPVLYVVAIYFLQQVFSQILERKKHAHRT